MDYRHHWILFFSLVCFAGLAPNGHGQAVTGNILGTVTDSSGAVVPGAAVTITDVLTGVIHRTVVDGRGDYIVPALPVGQYRVEAAMKGFQTFVQEGVTLTVNQNARVDGILRLGQITQNVVVRENAPVVDTHDVQTGGLVDRQRVQDLPIDGRNVYSLVTVLPGVGSVSTTSQPESNGGNTIEVNGARTTSASFLVDGGYNNGIERNEGYVAPNPDAVQEFQVITSNYDARYGHFAGGVVNEVVRSGANQFHGGAYDYLRNNALDSRSFFAPSVNDLKRNQFGATLGGPIRHNKLFGFFSYEGDRIRSGVFDNSAYPPTAAQRQGNFSSLPASKQPTDPTTGKPFPGGIIPTDRLDPVAQNILKLVPLPNTPAGQWQGFAAQSENDNQYVGKVDYQISSAHRLSTSLFVVRGDTLQPFAGLANIPGYSPGQNNYRQENVVANETWTIRPTLLNQFLFSFGSDNFINSDLNTTDWTDLGSMFQPLSLPPRTPQITVSGAWAGGTYGDGTNLDQTFDLSDTLTWMHGSHEVMVGSELLFLRHNQIRSWLGAGQVGVTGAYTGNANADFLLGQAATFRVNNGEPEVVNSMASNSFIQDNWKVLRRLTLNLGVRYELDTPYVSPYNYLSTFKLGSPLPQSQAIPAAPPGLVFDGDPGVPRGMYPTDFGNVAPRFGVVVDPFGNGKTAIRAGYGIFYSAIMSDSLGMLLGQPYLVDVTNFGTPSFVNPFGNWPGGNPFPLSGNVAKRAIVLPMTAPMVDPNITTPYVQQYSFVVQQQLRPNLSLEAGYFGNASRHLMSARDANSPIYIPGNSTASNVNSRRPILPGTYGTILDMFTGANADYNSLQVTLTQRYAHGFSLLANYTYSKSMDLNSADSINGAEFQDSNNIREDWGVSDFDRGQVLNVSLIWQPPKIQRFGFIGKDVLSGWQMNAIGRITSGGPFTVTAGKDVNLDGNNNDRANLIDNPVLSSGRSLDARLAEYFNTAAFVVGPPGTDGTAARNLLYGPGSVNWNVSFFKDIPIYEHHQVQFRSEFFNFFNTPNFGNPVATLSSGAFGRIQSAGSGRTIQFALRYSF